MQQNPFNDPFFDEELEQRMNLLEQELFEKNGKRFTDSEKEIHESALLFGYSLTNGTTIKQAKREIKCQKKLK